MCYMHLEMPIVQNNKKQSPFLPCLSLSVSYCLFPTLKEFPFKILSSIHLNMYLNRSLDLLNTHLFHEVCEQI